MATFSSWNDALRTVAWIVDPTLFNGWNGVNNWQIDLTPVETVQPFSTQDILKQRQQAYTNLWDTNLANIYWNLWNEADAYSNTANQIWGFYNALAQDVANREQWLADAKYNVANQLNQDLLNQRNYAMSMFWPQWQLTTEINKYYDDLWNYLASDAGRQMANIAAQWVHSWASLWAIRAQQNEAYNQSFARYVQAKEQEINAKTNVANQLMNYMSALRKEYWDTTNEYIINQYQRANDLLNNLSTSLAKDNIDLANLRLSTSLSGSGSWGWSSSWWTGISYTPIWDWYYFGSDWNYYKAWADWNPVMVSKPTEQSNTVTDPAKQTTLNDVAKENPQGKVKNATPDYINDALGYVSYANPLMWLSLRLNNYVKNLLNK